MECLRHQSDRLQRQPKWVGYPDQLALLVLNGLRVSEATGSDIERLGLERGHRTLTILRKGGKIVTIPPAPSDGKGDRPVDLAIGERLDGPIFLAPDGRPENHDEI